MGFIDSHLHLYNCNSNNGENMIDNRQGIGKELYLVNATSKKDWANVLDLYQQFIYNIIPFLGLHPWYIENHSAEDFTMLENLIANNKCGIGEVGLDYCVKDSNLREQTMIFELQLDFAQRYARPVTIHSVKAHNDIIRILKKFTVTPKFMVHSFNGSCQMAKDILDLGGYLSLSFSTLKMNDIKLKKLVQYIPSDKILLETDAPDQLPTKMIVERFSPENSSNEYAAIPVIQKLYWIIAELKGIDRNVLVDNIKKNCYEFIKGI